MSSWVGIGRSEIGLVRATNQDAFATIDPLGLWAVADGMGGHAGGDVAAQTAIASITAHAEVAADILRQREGAPSAFLADAIAHAHRAILGRAKLEPTLKGMGTTIVLLLIRSLPTFTAHVAHIGDSRAYHTLIEKYLEQGILTPKTARTHPDRHVLTQALGVSSPVKPSISSYPLKQEDLLLLCSDGLTKMLEDDDIRNICLNAHGDPIRICDGLINESLDRGGRDNVTVVVVAHT
jgi:protein phosphatase